VRPYPVATAGEPLLVSFDSRRRIFSFSFRHDPAIRTPTEIFVPTLQYPGGVKVEVSEGTWDMQGPQQRLIYRHGTVRREHSVRIS